MPTIRLFNQNERITEDSLNDAQALGIASVVEATDLGARVLAAWCGGAVLRGLKPVTHVAGATGQSVTLSAGTAIVIATGQVPRLVSSEQVVVPVPDPPPAGQVRIDSIVLAGPVVNDDTDSAAVYERDPTTGIVTPAAVDTRRTFRPTFEIYSGGAIAGPFSPGAGTGDAFDDVARAGGYGLYSRCPVLHVYQDETGIVALLDARPLIRPGALPAGSVLMDADTDDDHRRSDPHQWTWYGEEGTGSTFVVALGCRLDDGIPTAPFRILDAAGGVSVALPPGIRATAIKGATSAIYAGGGTTSPGGALPSTPVAGLADTKIAEIDSSGSGTVTVRAVGDGYAYAPRGFLRPADEPTVRVYPKIEIMTYEDVEQVEIRIHAVLADGSPVPLYVREGGILWEVEVVKDVADTANNDNLESLILTTGHNAAAATKIGDTRWTVRQDAGDGDEAWCEIALAKALVNLNPLRALVRVAPLLLTQQHASDPGVRGLPEWQAARSGLLRYVPGGPGLGAFTFVPSS